MHQPHHLAAQGFHQDDRPGNLQPPAGGAAAGPQNHQQEQNGLGKGRPEGIIGGGEAGGGHDGADLEGGIAEGHPKTAVLRQDIQGDQQHGRQGDAQIHPQLLAFEHLLEIPHKQQKIEVEIDAEQQHEHGDHTIHIGAVVKADAGVFNGEAAGAGGAEGIHQAVEQRHTARQQEHHLQQCQA